MNEQYVSEHDFEIYRKNCSYNDRKNCIHIGKDWVDALINMFKSRYDAIVKVIGSHIIDLEDNEIIGCVDDYVVNEVPPEPDYDAILQNIEDCNGYYHSYCDRY